MTRTTASNPMFADLEDYLERQMFEDAGILLGQILKEMHTEDDITESVIEEFCDGLHGEALS